MSIKIQTKTLLCLIGIIFSFIFVANIAKAEKLVQLQNKEITLSGVVTDINNEPLIGATVRINDTNIGTITDIDGKYTLTVPSNSKVTASFIGYKSKTAIAGERSILNFVLEEDLQELDAVVVTALGIKRAEKALSYNVQQVDANDIVDNKDVNFINSINGKVAGVVINSSSGGVGSSSRVVMRGVKSINQSSNALYVVDGVPLFVTAREGGTEFGSQGTTDPLSDINPEDIESMSVLNGAAAAALYGSDAANGAIIITTKRGQADKTSVTLSSGIEIMTPFVLPKFQNIYGTGDIESTQGSLIRSWGKKLNNENYMGYDPKDDYFQTGYVATNNISLTTGNDKNQIYLSAGAVNSEGIVENNVYDKYNFTFKNTTKFLNDKMTLNTGVSYVKQNDLNMVNQGTYNNPIVGAYIFPRGNSWDDIKMFERYDAINKVNIQYWPFGDAGMTVQNPYWINYRNLRENDKERYMLDASLSYDVLHWLNLAGRVRVDNSNTKFTEKFYGSSNTQLTEGSSYGLYGLANTVDEQIYADVLANINKNFEDNKYTLTANIGASISDIRNDASKVRGPIRDGIITSETPSLINIFNIQNLSNTSLTERLQEGWREQTQSVFGSLELGYKSTYYLSLTARNDWPSALAGPHSTKKSFFYPSVGLSAILSEAIKLPEEIQFLKIRASYASVGVAFQRFIANPLYEWSRGGLNWGVQTTYPAYNLRPEKTDSYEVGVAAKFLKHFNLDLTLYHTNTRNQTFFPQISSGSGSSEFPVQSGNVRNRGIEFALGYENTWRRLSWSTNYTLSINKNEIISLGENLYNPVTGEQFSIDLLNMGGYDQAQFILKEGGSMGDLYSIADLQRDDVGAVYIDKNGNINQQAIKDPKDYIKLGSVQPDANMAWRNDFKYRNFNLGFMVTARFGGIVYSQTQAFLDYYGVSEKTADARNNGGVIINGGDLVTANKWYSSIVDVPQYNTYSATNIRLQELSLGYTIPKKVLSNICEINVSLVGRNLLMLYNKAPFDPETSATVGNYYQGIDNFMLPSLRNIGFNLRFKF